MFEHLKEQEVKGKTAELPMPALRGCPKLIVKPATESNKDYFNEVLRKSAKSLRRAAKGELKVDVETLEKNRRDDRILFPKYVIVGWEGIKDSKGNEVPFTPENCAEFLQALPDWIFDDIGIFCRKNSNFVPDSLDDEEADELAKN